MWAAFYISLFGRVLAEIIQKFSEDKTNINLHVLKVFFEVSY